MEESVEAALWSAVRVLEESAALERHMAQDAIEHQSSRSAERFKRIAADREQQAQAIRELLMAKSQSSRKEL